VTASLVARSRAVCDPSGRVRDRSAIGGRRRRLAFCGALAACGLHSATARAVPSARLVYSRTESAESCPDESALRAAVAARIGYDAFYEPDAGCGADAIKGYGCLDIQGATSFGQSCSYAVTCPAVAMVSVDCGKFALCGGEGPPGLVCRCTSNACAVVTTGSQSLAFDLQLGQGTLNGTVTGLQVGNSANMVLNVVMTQQ